MMQAIIQMRFFSKIRFLCILSKTGLEKCFIFPNQANISTLYTHSPYVMQENFIVNFRCATLVLHLNWLLKV